ncbi:MAG: hypothetical protein WDN24_21425 [Sphingomonas sp.]
MSIFVIALALAAAAQDPALDRSDARCLAATSLSMATLPENEQDSLSGMLLYYLGKLAGRNGDPQVAALIDEAQAGLGGAELGPIVSGCADELGRVAGVLKGG